MVSVVQNSSLSEFFTGCKDHPDLRLFNIEDLGPRVRSVFNGFASRRGLRHKAQGIRHKERISFLLLFLPCALCLKPCAVPFWAAQGRVLVYPITSSIS